VQTLSNEIFTFKRQLESTRHTIEDLEGENRRLRIELEGSRVRLNEQNSVYIYSEDDLAQLK
jgi:regulator of replication initiation timing